jgi:hypothetical protein
MTAMGRWEWVEAKPVRRLAIALGGAGLAACALGAIWDTAQFFHSYLFAFMAWLAIGLGSLPLLMLHHLTGGRWGYVIRRTLEAATRTLPMMLVFSVPLAFGIGENYGWSQASANHENTARSVYFEKPFFFGRASVYFAIWLILMYLLNRWSLAHDRTGDSIFPARSQSLSGPGLVLYGLTVTFAAVDWVMSLESHWYSTIFGAVVATAQMLPALGLAIALMSFKVCEVRSAECGVESQESNTEFRTQNSELSRQFALRSPVVWNDLGNLLLAFVMLWTYMAFSQFLLIWSGNLPEEITWYLARSEGGWVWIAVVLAAFNFGLPFVLLLSRDIKRRPKRLRTVALAVVVMNFVYYFWLIAPAFSPGMLFLHWMDIAAVLGLGGLWLAYFLWQLQQRPVLPLHLDTVGEEVPQHA